MASVSEDKANGGGRKLRWREKQADGSWKARSYSVSTPQAATEVKAAILRALETVGHWEAPRVEPAPVPEAPAAVADLERGALAWLEAEKARKIASSTIRTRGMRLNVWHRALRAVAGVATGAQLPVSVLNRQNFSRALLVIADEGSGDRAQYDIACTAFAAWEWLADAPEDYPGLVAPPRDRTRLLPRMPEAPEALPAGTLAEMDAIVRGALVAADEARAGSFVMADLHDIMAIQRYTGLRISSVAPAGKGKARTYGIRVCDVYATEGTIRVAFDKVKSMVGRRIPVSPHAMVILVARVEKLRASGAAETAPLFAGLHQRAPLKALEHAAPEIRPEIWSGGAERDGGRTTHVFRAAVQRDLEERGVTARVIDRLVGHTPADVRTKHYVPPTVEEMRAAVNLIPPIDHGALPDKVVRIRA